MEEKQVTIDGQTYKMSEPFVVLATQNPIEQEGTYRLPEAQLDRFIFKIDVDYPSGAEELDIITKEHERKNNAKIQEIASVISGANIKKYKELITHVSIEGNLLKYIADIVVNTRTNSLLYLGASPRGDNCNSKSFKSICRLKRSRFCNPRGY